MQKVLGATPGRVFRQHMAEAFLVCGASLALSLPLAAMLLPSLGRLFGRSLDAAALFDPLILLVLIAFGAAVSLLSGAYPALVLSRLKPSAVLKGSFSVSTSGIWLRKSIIVLQFFISVGLIICTLVLQDQLQYIQERNLGYDTDHVVVIRMDRQTADRLDVLRSEFMKSGRVESVSAAYETPTHIQGGYSISSSLSDERGTPVTALPADDHFLKMFDIQLVAGRALTRADVDLAVRINRGRDSTSALPILINESQARAFGWMPEEAVGRRSAAGSGTSPIYALLDPRAPLGNRIMNVVRYSRGTRIL